ncbi:MAG: TRAP transporter small permease [Planctomycetaceae bacterium]|nr:TRAP transporter small permease [Planctomycetaceae bacterium]
MKKQSIGIVQWLIMILFTVMCVLILVMTVSRITGLAVDRFLWAEEASRYLMIWMSFLAAILAARSNSHFRMTALTGGIRSPAVRRALGALAALCSVAIMVVVLYYGYHLILRQIRSGQSSPVMLIPMWTTYLAIPVGFAGMLMWTVVNEVRAFRSGAADKTTEEKQ